MVFNSGLHSFSIAVLTLSVLLLDCGNVIDPIDIGRVDKVNDYFLAYPLSGSINTHDADKIIIRKGCFTCEAIKVSAVKCTQADFDNNASCSTITTGSTDAYIAVKIIPNSTLSSGSYYMILEEGAILGGRDTGNSKTVFSGGPSSTDKANISIFPYFYEFTVP